MAFRVKTIRIRSWAEIQAHIKPGWLFRGQSDSDWDLETSLERCCKRQKINSKKRKEFETALLREFTRGLHQYVTHVPDAEAKIEWLSVMQHHGAPTRLLDFTYSIYVAAYFALETADAECAVWGIRAPWVIDASTQKLKKAGVPKAQLLKKPHLDHSDEEHLFNMIFSAAATRAVIPLNPFRLNERLRIQKGIFLIPSDISASFMENLASLTGYDDEANIVKLILSKSMRRDALEQLFYMSLTRTTLFPGLDGYAQSLGVFHNSHHPLILARKKP